MYQFTFCGFHLLATYMVTSGLVPPCHMEPKWLLYSAASLGDLSISTIIRYPTQSYYFSDTELTSPCPILVMPSARLDNNMCQFCKSLIWLDWDSNSQTFCNGSLRSTETAHHVCPYQYGSPIESSKPTISSLTLDVVRRKSPIKQSFFSACYQMRWPNG